MATGKRGVKKNVPRMLTSRSKFVPPAAPAPTRKRWLSPTVLLTAAGTGFAAGYYIKARKAVAALTRQEAEKDEEIATLRKQFEEERNKNLVLSPFRKQLLRQIRNPDHVFHYESIT